MNRVSSKNYLHSRACKRYLEKGRNLEYQNGYWIHKWCNKYLNKLDFNTQRFWVAKRDLGNIHRGQKIFSNKKRIKYEAQGGKVREITCYKKETRKAMRELIVALDIPTKWQHGFTRNRDIFTQFEELTKFALRRNFKVSVVSLDLENAFNQLTEEQIFCIFRFIFKLNKNQSTKLASVCCINGHLFQGNTIAPLLFNIWFSRLYAMIDKMQYRNMLLTNYADDITLITLYPSISWKFLRFITKLIRTAGFKINRAKTKIRNGINMEATGLQYRFDCWGNWKVMPRSLGRLNNNLRLWDHMETLGIENTLRMNKEGKMISVSEMKRGLNNWKNRIQMFSPA